MQAVVTCSDEYHFKIQFLLKINLQVRYKTVKREECGLRIKSEFLFRIFWYYACEDTNTAEDMQLFHYKRLDV